MLLHFQIITTRIRRMGKVLFSVCQFTPRQGEGYPIWLMGGGVTPSQVWMGVPIPGPDGGYPVAGLDRGGVSHPADRGYPHPRSGWGYPPHQDWVGVPPPPSRLDGVPPRSRLDGLPPCPGLVGYPPVRRQISTCYAGAVCLLRSRRRTFML